MATDAYMRDFDLVVPSDRVASMNRDGNEYALLHLEMVLRADVRPSQELSLQLVRQEAVGQLR